MILVYPRLDVIISKFLLIQKLFLREFDFNDVPYLEKLCQRNVTTQSGESFTRFCFFRTLFCANVAGLESMLTYLEISLE